MGDTPYNKLQGDPDVVRSKAQHYQNIADAIQRSTITLKKVQDMEGMKSKAVEALKDSAKSVADDIDKAHDRYDKTAKALITYSSRLRSAQQAAETAISNIADKQQAATAAHTAATKADTAADEATDDAKGDASKAAEKAGTAADTADSALAAAHKQWHDALDDKNDAAEAAIKAIVDVVDHHNNGLKNPGFWDKVMDVVKKVCEIAGVLAIFLSWVPVLGQVLLVLAVVGAVLTLVDAVVKFANGEGSFWSVLGAAAGLVLTVFGGRLFTYLGKVARIRGLMKVAPRVGGVRTQAQTFRRVAAGRRLLKSARRDLFKLPGRNDFRMSTIWQKSLASGGGEREAWKAIFTGSGSRIKAMQDLAGIDNNVVRALAHDPKSPLNLALATNQLNSVYNKGRELYELPNSVSGIFGGDDVTPKAPNTSLSNLAQKGADKVPDGYKSYN